MEEDSQVKLSKGILEMKFMKKTKERVLQEEDNAQGQAMYSNEITKEMKKTGNTVFIDISLGQCKELIDGRLSFGGMNPAIEKLMENDYAKKLEHLEKQKEKDITDAEMAKGYSTLVNTVNKKFQNKRNRGKKSFIKPNPNEQF